MKLQFFFFFFYSTDCGFAPHGEMVYTGTSFDDKNGSDGVLAFFDSKSFDLIYRITYPNLVGSSLIIFRLRSLRKITYYILYYINHYCNICRFFSELY